MVLTEAEAKAERRRAANRESSRLYYEKNREAVKEANRLYQENNREVVKERHRLWREKNSEAVKEYNRLWREKNSEAVKEYKRLWSEKNREVLTERRRLWRKNNPEVVQERQRRSNLKRKYNITPEQCEARLVSQNYLCASCGLPAEPNKRLVVDHNHKTGKVRQLLHNNCNVLIGLAGENVEVLEGAIRYIKSHQ